MVQNLGCSEVTFALWAFHTKFRVHMKVFGMICHQPWLYPLITYWTLHLSVRVTIQAGRKGGAGRVRGNYYSLASVEATSTKLHF